MDQNKLRKLAGLPTIKESVTKKVSEQYAESSDFDSDISDLNDHLNKALKIVSSANWAQHLKDTVDNFGVDGLDDTHDKLLDCIKQAVKEADDYYELMLKAS